MTFPTPTIRPFAWSNLRDLASLIARVDDPTANVDDDAVERLRRELRMPGRAPERDCFVAAGDDGLAGYALVTEEPPLRRAVLRVGVLERWRRRGVGRALVRAVVEHARELGLTVVQADVPEGAAGARALFASLDFGHVRTHLHLRRSGGGPVEAPHREGVTLRELTPGDVPALTDLQNAAFTGSWGYSPNVPEEIRYRVFDQPMHGPDDVLLLFEGGELAAYCWSHVEGPGKPGFIGMVGTHPSKQGRGLGRIVTAAGLNRLVQRGFDPIDITVDSANTPAVRLYEGLGFRPIWRSLWYELPLDTHREDAKLAK